MQNNQRPRVHAPKSHGCYKLRGAINLEESLINLDKLMMNGPWRQQWR